MHASPPYQNERNGLPDGITVRPLTFIDNLKHSGTLLQAMIGRDLDARIIERSRATYLLARWLVLPVYLHLACAGYGAFAGEKLAGLLYLRGRRGALHVNALAVHPDYRRRGLGRALLHLAEEQARRQGRRWLSLRVTLSNEAAMQLYRSEGFRLAGEPASQPDGRASAGHDPTERPAVKATMLKPLVSAEEAQEGSDGR